MGSVKQGIKIKRANNSNAKFKLFYTKLFQSNKDIDTKQVKYIYKKRIFGKKYKFIYKYR